MSAVKIADLPTLAPPKQKMTWEEFLAWCDEDTWAEWVDGEVQMVSPANRKHQKVALWLAWILNEFASQRNLGEALIAPFLMRLPNVPSGREPDILFVRRENLARLHDAYLDGPADLVIEIVSPESIGRDRGDKFIEYEIAGVLEYWLLDYTRRRAEFYVLDSSGMFQIAEPDAQGIYRSRVVEGFWLRVAWLWQEPLPMAEDVLREIRGV